MKALNLTENLSDSDINIIFSQNNCTYSHISLFRAKYSIIHGYLATILCIGGIVANIANIIVLSRPKMAASPVNYLLMIIAIAEMLLMTVYLPYSVYFFLLNDDDTDPLIVDSKTAAQYLYFYSCASVVFQSVAVWHTIAVAMYRWLTLRAPLGNSYYTKRNTFICSVILIIVNILLSIPNWIVNQVYSYNDYNCHTGEYNTKWTVVPRQDIAFNNSLFGVFGKLIPCALLTVLTILLIVIMHRAKKRRQQLLKRGQHEESKRQYEHDRTTAMLLAVVVIFLLIELPHGIIVILIRDNKEVRDQYYKLGDVIDIITLIAFSITFILYTAMSRQFRSTFFSLFCKKPLESQTDNFRRLSTMVTSVKPTVSKRSGISQASSTSCHQNSEDKTTYLSPIAPLLNEGNSITSATSSMRSEESSGYTSPGNTH